MRELGVEGLSEDQRYLIVRDPTTDEKFRVPFDPEMPHQPIHRERSMDIHLTPREIQARIRRGESSQDLADATGMTIESIEPFAGAVIAERAYIAQQAQRTSVRRRHVTSSGARLGELVAEGLREKNLSPDDAVWDAFRREDGRWTVVLTPDGSDNTATFLYDADGRYTTAVDDFAHDLVADVVEESSDMALADAIRETVPAEAEEVVVHVPDALELDLGLTTDDPALLPAVSSLKEARDRRAQIAMTQPTGDDQETAPEQDHLDEVIEHDIAVPDAAPPSKKRHERRRVPSWDEIMFGDRPD